MAHHHHREADYLEAEAPAGEDSMGHDHHRYRRARAGEGTSMLAGEKRDLHMRATLESSQVADHLTALAQALRAGGVTLRSGGRTLMLHAAESMELEVHAGEEGEQSVVRLALRWQTPVPRADLEITPGVGAEVSAPADATRQRKAASAQSAEA